MVEQLTTGERWRETGSTIVVNDAADIADSCRRILERSTFDARVDMAVVFDLESRDARARGPFVNCGLFTIVPRLKWF